MGTDSYSAETKGIDIVFEKGTETTGTITCTYSFATPSSSAGSPNETCTGANGDYYTHPAFTFGDEELTGIPPKIVQPIKKQWVDIGYYTDENGIKRKGVIKQNPWRR